VFLSFRALRPKLPYLRFVSRKKENLMKIKNKATVVATSLIAITAIALASPALASKSNPSKATSSATSTPSTTATPPSFGMGDGDNDGGRGHGHGRGHGPDGGMNFTPITKSVTVDVPATGTYQLLVTEVKPANAPTPPAGAPVRPDHSFTVPVTGTGSQTITLNLPHPGDYKVSLISVVSTQSITVTATN
jgi:hypothetical protein